MGKYSNIDANGLKQAAITALNEINNHTLNGAYNTLSKNKNLNTACSKTITKALNDIMSSANINGSINKLKIELNKLIDIGENMIKYEEADAEIKRLEPDLYYQATRTEYKTVEHMYSPRLDANGNQVYDATGRAIQIYDPHTEYVPITTISTEIDSSVQNRINALKSNMETYERNIQANLQ